MKPEIETQASRKGNNMPDAKAMLQNFLHRAANTRCAASELARRV